MLASGACAKKDQEQCLSISAFGSMAGCGLPQVTQQQPELCLLESRMLMEESGCQRNKELGDAAELARLLKQRSCDHSLVNTGNKISLMVLLQPSAALQAPLMNHQTQKPRGANWHQRCSLPLPESSTLKTKFFFFWVQQKHFLCVRAGALCWLLPFSLEYLGKGYWTASLACSSHKHAGGYSEVGYLGKKAPHGIFFFHNENHFSEL